MEPNPARFIDQTMLFMAIDQSSSRGLTQATKWLTDFAWTFNFESLEPLDIPNDPDPLDYRFAKALFDCGEYRRCSAQLLKTNPTDPKSRFLRLYSQYLAGEQSREEANETILGPNDGKVNNQELVKIIEELEMTEIRNEYDSYLLYLRGLVYRQLNRLDEAIAALTRAVFTWEPNWAAWEELSACMETPAMINRVLSELSESLYGRIFQVVAHLDLHASGDEIGELLTSLEKDLGTSVYFKSLRAILAYNAQDFETAETIFDEILEQDPHRLDNLDIYSNVLFVLDRRAKLGHLAKIVSSVDKFRSETCCVIGNYYSLLSDHEKAVTYFRKALKLNRSYLAAWTLMGHEYVELKNTHAAIESYRRAVDINKKDYRAWYGLGQAYEMLEMHYYALHYFQRAAALKPYDLRMWTAMGNCYEKLGRFSESIKAYQRALLGDGTLDIGHLMKIGELYERAGDLGAARKHFQAAVDAAADPSLDAAPAQDWLERHNR